VLLAGPVTSSPSLSRCARSVEWGKAPWPAPALVPGPIVVVLALELALALISVLQSRLGGQLMPEVARARRSIGKRVYADRQDCPPCAPKDCHFAGWGHWHHNPDAVNCTSVCFRKRHVAVPRNRCGRPCSGFKEETKPCIETCPLQQTEDCIISDWHEWSTCVKKQREHSREVTRPAQGGRACEGALHGIEPCDLVQPSIVHCQIGGSGHHAVPPVDGVGMIAHAVLCTQRAMVGINVKAVSIR
jgi:hypothetical protein